MQIRELGNEYKPTDVNKIIEEAKKKLDGKGLISILQQQILKDIEEKKTGE